MTAPLTPNQQFILTKSRRRFKVEHLWWGEDEPVAYEIIEMMEDPVAQDSKFVSVAKMAKLVEQGKIKPI